MKRGTDLQSDFSPKVMEVRVKKREIQREKETDRQKEREKKRERKKERER